MEFLDKVKAKLAPNTKAFTAVLVGSIMAILIGSVLLIITYLVLSSVITAIGTVSNEALNTSMFANINVITQALTITGVSLIVAGVAGIIYMLMGVAGMAGGARGR
jgi:uncharacterized metal-binding protein